MTTAWGGPPPAVVVQQEEAAGDRAIAGENWSEAFDAEPRSAPTLYNLTLVSPRSAVATQGGVLFEHGGAGTLINAILTGFSSEGVDLREAETAACAAGSCADPLVVGHTLFYDIGASGSAWTDDKADPDDDDDGGFDEASWLADPDRANLFGEPPLLPNEVTGLERPDFVPLAASPAASGGATPPEGAFWDRSATWLGALQPGEASWLDGWTAFPPD